MKRTFLFLLILIVVVYAKQAYNLHLSNLFAKERITGSLSDVAEEVIAIPLEPAGDYQIKKARNVRQEGKNLFLISDETLYRYSRNGEFICRITNPAEIKVAGYVVNQLQHELIVLGNTDDIFYYSYEGELLEKKKLKSDLPEQKMLSVSMHKDRIWMMEEHVSVDTETNISKIEKQVVGYDTSFRKKETRKLIHSDLGREQYMPACFSPQLFVDKGSDLLYAHSPSLQPEHLLTDTLYLKQRWRNQLISAWYDNSVPLFPVNPGSRFWLSTYTCSSDESLSYTFFYDTKTEQGIQVQGGFHDNFYQTGRVEEIENMDMYNQTYCFCKSGKDVENLFPDKTKGDENVVLFIVKLKQA